MLRIAWITLPMVLLIDGLSPGQCGTGPLGQWSPRSAMLDERREISAVELDGKIYVLGDYNYSPDNHRLSVYDPGTDVWTELASMITPRGMAAAAAHGGKIYYFCGNNCVANCWLTTNEVYDPATDTWEVRASLPDTGRGFLSATTVGDKIYVMGGANSYFGYFDDVWIYDPIADSWSAGTPMPSSRGVHTAVLADGKIYLMGGNEDPATGSCAPPILRVDVYDPAAEAAGDYPWSVAADLPFLRRFHGACEVNGRIYIVGGEAMEEIPCASLGLTDSVQEYDPVLDCWRDVAPLAFARDNLAAVALDGAVYAIGGNASGADISDLDRLDFGPWLKLDIGDVTIVHDDGVVPTEVSVGITLEQTAVTAPLGVQGLELRWMMEGAYLSLTSADIGADLAAACGGAGPDFLQVEQCGDVMTAGIVVSTMGACDLQLSAVAELITLNFAVLAVPPSGTTPLSWEDGLGCNGLPLTNEVIAESAQIDPLLQDGSVTFIPVEFFRRGDCNQDAAFGVADAVFLINHLFVLGSPAPSCDAACDANGDAGVDLSDVVYSLNALFIAGSPYPPAPFPGCGPGALGSPVTCVQYAGCP